MNCYFFNKWLLNNQEAIYHEHKPGPVKVTILGAGKGLTNHYPFLRINGQLVTKENNDGTLPHPKIYKKFKGVRGVA